MPVLIYQKGATPKSLDEEFSEISKKLSNLELPKGFLEFVLYVISELFANIKEHSRAKAVSVSVKLTQQNCSIKIADKGVGFRKSYLAKNIYPKDDFSAIEFALSGLSTKDSRERGFGLYSIRKLTEALGGEMVIESGSARALAQKNQLNFKENADKIQGVIIAVHTPVEALDFYKFVE